MKRWSVVFKTLSNINRLKIIKLLSGNQQMSVSRIAEELDISFKATSKHLLMLHDLDILNSTGKSGQVFYSLNRKNMPSDIKQTIALFIP